MRIHQLDYEVIQYQPCSYDRSLEESILRIGCSFPLHVEIRNHSYVCIDGKKRLSALHELDRQGRLEAKRRLVPVMIINAGDFRSTPQHRIRNHH